MELPNFSELWRASFKSSNRVNFQIRSDSSRPHDLIFMSSLVHDSTILSVENSSETSLKVDISRDRWERYENNELPSVKSSLFFQGVTDWLVPTRKEIDFIQINEWDFRNTEFFEFFFYFHDGTIGKIRMHVSAFSIHLLDAKQT